MSDVEMEIGPIDYILLEYPGAQPTGEALPHLINLVEQGIIRILDVALILKGDDGSFRWIDLSEVAPLGVEELAVLEGAVTGMLDDDDIAAAAEALEPGSLGAVLVYENSWAAPFATALRRAGAQLVASGRIPVQDVLTALEASEKE